MVPGTAHCVPTRKVNPHNKSYSLTTKHSLEGLYSLPLKRDDFDRFYSSPELLHHSFQRTAWQLYAAKRIAPMASIHH